MRQEYVEVYERLEREHWWWIVRRKLVLKALNNLPLDRKNKPALLDIGCGAGLGIASMNDQFSCTGIEPDPLLLQRARENTHVPVLQTQLPLAKALFDSKFDLILLLDVLEHVVNDREALKSTAEYLKPGGYIIINVPAMRWLWSSHDEINQHHRRYVANELEAIIRDMGFGIHSLRYWGSFLAPLAFLGRRLSFKKEDRAHEVKIPNSLLNNLMIRSVLIEYSLTKAIPLPMGLSLLAVISRESGL